MRKLLNIAVLTATVCGSGTAQQLPDRASLKLDEQGAWIVQTTKVSRQLNLGPSQKRDVSTAFERYSEAQRQVYSHGAPTMVALDKLDHSLAESVLEVLTETQRVRLHEICLQLKGPFVLEEDSEANRLALKPDQRAETKRIIEGYDKREADLHELTSKSLLTHPHATNQQRKEIFAGLEPKRIDLENEKREAGEKILSLLTAAQRKTWTQMLGPHML